jgi:hypothetical protein
MKLATVSFVPAVCALLLVVPGRLRAEWGEYVTVSSTAAKDYVRPLVGRNGELRPESYVFAEGEFFGGSTRDAGMEKVPFREVVTTVGRSLARQNYFPAKDPKLADLLVVVYWGTTTVEEDPNKQLNVEALNSAVAGYNAAVAAAAQGGPPADPAELNGALNERDNAATSANSIAAFNAKLLGYSTALRKRRDDVNVSTEERTYREDLAEERYFVVLMAYDYAALMKEHTRRLRWTTRMSVSASGANFRTSLAAMNQMAANYFGKQVDDLQRGPVTPKEGKVEIGEVKVVDDPAPVAKPKK